MQAIKVGNSRIVLDNVTYVEERQSTFLRTMSDGTWAEDFYAKKEETETGLVIMVYFPSPGGESDDYVKFIKDEAEEFLRKFDAIMETK